MEPAQNCMHRVRSCSFLGLFHRIDDPRVKTSTDDYQSLVPDLDRYPLVIVERVHCPVAINFRFSLRKTPLEIRDSLHLSRHQHQVRGQCKSLPGFMKHRSSFFQGFLIQRWHLHRTSDNWDVETAPKKSIRMQDKGYSLRGPVQKLWQISEMVEMTMAQNHRLNAVSGERIADALVGRPTAWADRTE